MATYLTAYPVQSFGRWLVALAVSLALLALAYAQAPDPAGQLGWQPTGTHPSSLGRPAASDRAGLTSSPQLATRMLAAARPAPPGGAAPAQAPR